MLIVRFENGFTLNLERSIGGSGKHGILEFHPYMRTGLCDML
jgi:hypothetical protein